MNWAVIMAGGSGTRFWPLSYSNHPKQFLKLLGDKTPAEACIKRLSRFIEPERILMVASRHHREVISKVLPDFPQDQILWEPVGRNTAACIAWATETIRRRDFEARIGVFPSDHDIRDEQAFVDCLSQAYQAAQNQIVLFGIEPDRPETGYGYIETGDLSGAEGIHKVASFREKPDFETAQHYLASKKYLWNSGMFIFDATTMHDELQKNVPQIVSKIAQIVDQPECLDDIFPTLMSISIDYAVMEHTQKAVVIRGAFPWDDLGTWASIRKYYPKDEQANAKCGNARFVEASDNFVYIADEREVAVLGLSHVIIVSTPEAVLVMDDSRSQDVRLMVK